MNRELDLNKKTVKDIRNLLIPQPITAKKGDTIEDVFNKLSNDLRIRNIYVTDDDNKLVGAVRMNVTLEYLFPLASLVERGGNFRDGWVPKLSADGIVSDIMNPKPRYVTEEQSLSEVAQMFLREKVTELPVVDAEMKLIGQVNPTEIIVAYLNSKYTE